MIDFHYWPTPNGWKVAIMLEELGLPYRTVVTDISKGAQFAPEFMRISPNNRMPAIVDHDVAGPPVSVFESGAILFYLAEKTGRLIPQDPAGRKEALEWLFWQTGNQGPMAGQLSHFVNYAPDGETYSRTRYANEYDRCLGVLDRRLADRDYVLGGDYTVADVMCWPWVLIARPLGASLEGFPNLARWRALVKERPAVRRGVDLGKEHRPTGGHGPEERRILFGQTADSVARRAARAQLPR